MAGSSARQLGVDYLPRLLFLPAVDENYSDDTTPFQADLVAGEHKTQLPDRAADTPEQLFWYRWLLGHQLSFMFWRMLSDLVRSEDALQDQATNEAMARCVDAYSAMLLYSSTVPRHIYHNCIRARMRQHHPAFSGTWAPDYRPISQVLRGRSSLVNRAEPCELATAVARNKTLHDHIAEHLVPGGRSLLRDAAGRGMQATVEDKFDLYDNFFLTVRRPITRDMFAVQLLSRIDEVERDLSSHGLYPVVHHSRYPVLEAEAAEELGPCVGDLTAVLRGAAAPVVRVLEERAG